MKVILPMNRFSKAVSVAIITLAISSFAGFAESGNSKSVSQLIDTLAKDPNEHARIKAVLLLGETGDAEADAALVRSILTDSSYRVRVTSLRVRSEIFQQIVTKLYQEQDSGLRSAAETKEKISDLRKQHSASLKELFRSSYKYNCNYSNEVKAMAARSFYLSEDAEILPLAIEELKKNCALSFAERMERESPRTQLRGDVLILRLQHLIASYGKTAVPLIEKEYRMAQKGDYKCSLLIILNKISQKLEYSKDAAKYVPVHKFDPNLLPQCEECLLVTQGPGIKQELVDIMRVSGYVPASSEAQKIKNELSDEKDADIKH